MALSHLPQPSFDTGAMGSAVYSTQNSGPVELLPNPDFVFPARAAEDSTPPSLSAWNSLNRRPRSDQNLAASASNSRVRMRQSASALPNFTFNPSGPSSGQTSPTLSTPPHSPTLLVPSTPSRTARHRRGGSELIGGHNRTGSVNMVHTSPVKPNSTSQPVEHLAPPPNFRRHAHRRSGAMSCHDLSMVLLPKEINAQPKGNSAPVTPLEPDNRLFFGPNESRRSLSQSSIQSIAESANNVTDAPPTPQRRPPPRSRVGFSTHVEFIRPLSTISSETESSMSTIRGHSVTGSMSSVVSAGAASPSSSRMARPSLNTTFEDETPKERPRTSGNVVDMMTQHRQLLNVDVEVQRPKSMSGASPVSPSESPVSRPKKKGFSWWDSKRARSPPTTATRLPLAESDQSFASSPPDSPNSVVGVHDSEGESTRDNDQKKPRKVASWAHSFISRKQKTKKDAQLPSPASPTEDPMETADLITKEPLGYKADLDADFEPDFEANFDEDNTVTIISQTSTPLTQIQPWLASSTLSDSDALSPVIDLDAALGPFNTPSFNSNSRTEARPPPRARRSMHSLAFAAGASTTGNPNHRRTESAPELIPFDARAPKAVPASVMPDVFEEEDEEEFSKDSRRPSSIPEAEEPAEEEVETMVVKATESTPPVSPGRPLSGSFRLKKCEGLAISTSNFGKKIEVSVEHEHSNSSRDSSPVEVVEDYEEPRDRKASDETITPPHTANKDDEEQTIMRFSLPLASHQLMTPDTLSGSSLSSPDFCRSRGSLDTPRLGTGTSSVNEGRSFPFGEPGPEVRSSVDDVPSLTSSRSTMTSPLQHASIPYTTERSGSVYSSHSATTTPDLRRKRGSIASLSRLVTGSFGERSKLNIESRPMSQHVMPVTAKEQKRRSYRASKRISKLVQFLKPRDSKKMVSD